MQGLKLTLFKKSAFLKFQIQQYASIYEALLDYTLETYHKKDIENSLLTKEEYSPISAFAQTTEMYYTDSNSKKERILPCVKKLKKQPLKTIKISERTLAGVNLGIFDASIKQSLDMLYDSRNTIHILKAAKTNYTPTLAESQEAFLLMPRIVNAIKEHIATLNQ